MLLARSRMISDIDRYCAEELSMPLHLLMGRAGAAVARLIRESVPTGSTVTILAGKGNNGGDGYSAACLLMDDYSVAVVDVFSMGQRTEEGRFYLNKYLSNGGRVEKFEEMDDICKLISDSDCIVDAIFGTGFAGRMPDPLRRLSDSINLATRAFKVAIDVPLGVNADDGSVAESGACAMSATVALSFVKPGLLSFPAKAYVGRLVLDDLGIPRQEIADRFAFTDFYVDRDLARSLLPNRPENSNKGSFGKLLCIVGSEQYRGAAHLALEGALRGGVGLVGFLGVRELVGELSAKFPEVIYHPVDTVADMTDSDIGEAVALQNKYNAVLIGSGSGTSSGLLRLLCATLTTDGPTVILDADAINALSSLGNDATVMIKNSPRTVLLTPHPLEFSRLTGNDVSMVQLHRIEDASKFAAETGALLLLKGAATVCTDGGTVYINSTGSSALSKAGSGDVLAGFVGAMTASGVRPLSALAICAYFHGYAADSLSQELSLFGVTPSDLPREICRAIADVYR